MIGCMVIFAGYLVVCGIGYWAMRDRLWWETAGCWEGVRDDH